MTFETQIMERLQVIVFWRGGGALTMSFLYVKKKVSAVRGIMYIPT